LDKLINTLLDLRDFKVTVDYEKEYDYKSV